MPVHIESTPNPNALKFSVGVDVGGPRTFVAGREEDDPLAVGLLSIPGITSIFMTADFVTLTKTRARDWSEIAGPAQEILQNHFFD